MWCSYSIGDTCWWQLWEGQGHNNRQHISEVADVNLFSITEVSLPLCCCFSRGRRSLTIHVWTTGTLRKSGYSLVISCCRRLNWEMSAYVCVHSVTRSRQVVGIKNQEICNSVHAEDKYKNCLKLFSQLNIFQSVNHGFWSGFEKMSLWGTDGLPAVTVLLTSRGILKIYTAFPNSYHSTLFAHDSRCGIFFFFLGF